MRSSLQSLIVNTRFEVTASKSDASATPTRFHWAAIQAFRFLIKATPEEAFFAIFGHWGRGKTYVADKIALSLSKTHHIVWFSSRKYPNVPECWAFLFEIILKEIRKSGYIEYFSSLVLFNIIKNGFASIFYTSIILFIGTIIGLINGLEIIFYLPFYVGTTSMFLLLKFLFSGRLPVAEMAKLYGTPPSHREKLGLLEVLGDDVRLIIDAWTGKTGGHRAIVLRVLISLILFGAIVPLVLIYNLKPASEWKTPAILWSVWISFIVLTLSFAAFFPRSKKQVLLILDDLDRCPAEAALTVIKSISLLLSRHDKSSNIHAIALIDEVHLKRAVEARFSDPDLKGQFQGYLEKAFAAYIRLPPMEAGEFKKAARLILESDEINAAKAARDVAVSSENEAVTRQERIREDINTLKMELAKGPPDHRKEKYTVVHGIKRHFRGEKLYHEEIKERIVSLTEKEKSEWIETREKKTENLQNELSLSNKDLLEKKSATSSAEEYFAAICWASDALPQNDYNNEETLSSPLFSKNDSISFFSVIERLPELRNCYWGPRSAQAVYRKYILLKVLWSTLNATNKDSEQEPRALSEALFMAIKYNINSNATQQDIGDPQQGEMLRLASYIA